MSRQDFVSCLMFEDVSAVVAESAQFEPQPFTKVALECNCIRSFQFGMGPQIHVLPHVQSVFRFFGKLFWFIRFHQDDMTCELPLKWARSH